jgi:DNA-binding LytR/AlgR family response regulator
MRVSIKQIIEHANEQVVIECVEVTKDVEDIQAYALTKGTTLIGVCDDRTYQFRLENVFYFEAVDERVFAYTKEKVYELKIRLYELENAYSDKYFVRCSKSFVINLMKLESISPALNGRFMAHMKNGENIIVSRQYVPALKRAVMGGKYRGL